MKNAVAVLASAMLVSSMAYAQSPQSGALADSRLLSESPSRINSKIVIKTEPLRNNKIDVELNGQRLKAMEGNETYSAVVSPGKLRIAVPGDKPEARVEFVAEANKEYLFNVALVGSTSGGFLFGIVGSSAMATYSIELKETRFIENISQAQAEEDRKRAEEAQQKGRQRDQEMARSDPKMQASTSNALTFDYIAEGKKSARILGCPTENVKVVGAESNNVLVTAVCLNGPALELTCDKTGTCLKR